MSLREGGECVIFSLEEHWNDEALVGMWRYERVQCDT